MSRDKNEPLGAGEKLPASPDKDDQANAPYDERLAISKRLQRALDEAHLEMEFSLTEGMPLQGVNVQKVEVHLQLGVDESDYGKPGCDPQVFIFIVFSGGPILNGNQFEDEISAIISQVIGKSVHIELVEEEFQKPARAMMVCSDSISVWALADYVLEGSGYTAQYIENNQ